MNVVIYDLPADAVVTGAGMAVAHELDQWATTMDDQADTLARTATDHGRRFHGASVLREMAAELRARATEIRGGA